MKDLLKMNLNLFGEEVEPKEPDKVEEPKNKTFTQEELDNIISDRLKRERGKWDTELEEKLEIERTEAEKLARMNAEEKAKHEREKQEEELAKREADITRRELKSEALETLAEKGLPKGLAETFDYSSAEACQKSMDAVIEAFSSAIEEEVNKRMRQDPPVNPQGKNISSSELEARNAISKAMGVDLRMK